MNILIEKAHRDDLSEILVLQKIAYQKEAKRYNNFHIQPLTQTFNELLSEFQEFIILKASVDSHLVGSIRGKIKDHTCYLGRLMVHPDFQRKGIAKQLIKALEDMMQTNFPIERIELFTGDKSVENIALYESQGYVKFKTELLDGIKMVFMEKRFKN